MQTLPQLYLRTESGPPLSAERLQQMERTLLQDHESDMPWYLRFIVGLGAWLASAFFITFFIVLVGWDEKNRELFGVVGLILLAASLGIFRLRLGLFVSQCCLAASLAGQFMLYYGFLPAEHHTLASAAFLSLALAVLLYVLYPDILQRLIVCMATLQINLAWIYLGNNGEPFEEGHQLGDRVVLLTSLYWMLHLAGIGWCFLRINRQSSRLAPLGYALVLSLAAWQLENLSDLWPRIVSGHQIWFYYIRPVSTALALLGVITWASGGLTAWSRFRLPFMALTLALIAILWLGAGGVFPALFLITLGFFSERRVVLGIGLILLPVFMSSYYYNLHLDLLAKSVALIGSGLALILLRTGLQRWLPATAEVAS